MHHRRITRRSFLHGAAAVAAGISGGGSICSPALAARRRISANEKIVLGFIGVGGMGRSHFNRLLKHSEVHVCASADTDAQRRQAAVDAAAQTGVRLSTYNDFREMIDAHPELDAIFVATPDHWHALAAIHAMRAGKDVYCEKPLTLTIAEGRKMVETARRYQRILQMGTQQRSDQEQFRHVCELVVNGRIGEVRRVVCFFGSNPYHEYIPDEDAPPYLDWNRWLGPAPWRRFNRMIHPGNFRYFRDYSGGLLTDWGVHLFDIAQWGAGKDATSPRRIEAEGRMYPDNLYEFPKTCLIRYDYGDVVLEWRQGLDETVEPGEDYGTKFYGADGDVFVNRGGYRLHPKPGKRIDEALGDNDIRLYEASSHHQDFFNAMRSRKLPISDVETGHRATCISHLGNIAFRLGRPVEYDPVAERFAGDEAANKMLEKPMRAPWHI